jgi:environmental stress-induced protein Ves
MKWHGIPRSIRAIPFSMQAVNPAICWNDVQNNPFISAFEVDFLNLGDNSWINIGTTTANFIRFPSDIYNSESVYQIRIATIGTDGRRSSYAL